MSDQCFIQFDDERIVYDINSPLILEASAGSGKTTVLVERIIAIIVYQIFYEKKTALEIIESLVAITFTRKAAAEMRDRIRLKIRDCFHESYIRSVLERLRMYHPNQEPISLSEGMNWIIKNREQLIGYLSGAYISTVHSFALKLLRNHPVEAGIDPQATPEDESGMDNLTLTSKDALFHTLSHLIKVKDPDMVFLIQTIGFYKTQNYLSELLKTAIIIGLPQMEKTAYELGYLSDKNIHEMKLNQELYSNIQPIIPKILHTFEELRVTTSTKHVTQVLSDLTQDNIDELYITGLKYEDNDTKKEEVNRLREMVRQYVAQIHYHLHIPLFHAFWNVLKQYYKTYQELMRKRKMITFKDIEWKFLETLQNNSVFRNKLLSKFRYIMVDEYQDTNDIQKSIFDFFFHSAIIPFVVGDPKQSIYRFNNANVDIFRDTADTFIQRFGTKSKSYLNKNYRSSSSVVKTVNHLGKNLFLTDEQTSVKKIKNYIENNNSGWLEATHKFIQTSQVQDPLENIRLKEGIIYHEQTPAKKNDDNNSDSGCFLIPGFTEFDKVEQKRQVHAEWVALLVRDLIENQGFQPGDIMLLIRKTSIIPIINSTFEKMLNGIPFVNIDHENIIETDEINNIIIYLHALDDPSSDYYFLSLLKSPFFRYSDDQILTLRRKSHELKKDNDTVTKFPNFYQLLKEVGSEEMRVFSELLLLKNRLPIPDLVEKIITETGYYAFLTSIPTSKEATTNINIFQQKLRQIVNVEMFNITDLLYYLEIYGLNIGQPHTVGEKSNVIRVMTVHSAKGLESKVVIYLATSPPKTHYPFIRFSMDRKSMGLRINQPDHYCRNLEVEDDLYQFEEEKRLAYVAFTRSKNRFYYVGLVPHSIKNPKSHDSWKEFIYSELEDLQPNIINPPSDVQLDANWYYHLIKTQQQTADQRFLELLDQPLPLALQYPEILSVTQLLDIEFSEQSFINKYLLRSFPVSEALNEIVEDSDALFQIDNHRADYGTYIHKVLQNSSEQDYKQYIQHTIKLEHEAITVKENEIIDLVASFYESGLYQNYYKKSNLNKEEWEFNFSYSHALPSQHDAEILIKGAIDKYLIINGKGVIIDYKLKVPPGTLDRYEKQLNYYGYFIREMNNPVDEMFLYDIESGTTHMVNVKLDNVPDWLKNNVDRIIRLFTSSYQQ